MLPTFLVEHKLGPGMFLVFTHGNPRDNGFMGSVIEDVSLEYDDSVHSWGYGQDRPRVITGQHPEDPKQYKVFKYEDDLRQSGFRRVAGTVAVHELWSDFIRVISGHN